MKNNRLENQSNIKKEHMLIVIKVKWITKERFEIQNEGNFLFIRLSNRMHTKCYKVLFSYDLKLFHRSFGYSLGFHGASTKGCGMPEGNASKHLFPSLLWTCIWRNWWYHFSKPWCDCCCTFSLRISFCTFLVGVTAGGPESPRLHMKPSSTVNSVD